MGFTLIPQNFIPATSQPALTALFPKPGLIPFEMAKFWLID